jgi:hypothetical protein
MIALILCFITRHWERRAERLTGESGWRFERSAGGGRSEWWLFFSCDDGDGPCTYSAFGRTPRGAWRDMRESFEWMLDLADITSVAEAAHLTRLIEAMR